MSPSQFFKLHPSLSFLIFLHVLLQSKYKSYLNSTTKIRGKGISEPQTQEVKPVTGYPLFWTQIAQIKLLNSKYHLF